MPQQGPNTENQPQRATRGQEKGKVQVEQALPSELDNSKEERDSHIQCVQYGKNFDGCHPVTQKQNTSMTSKYHKPMVKLRYHQNMDLSQTSSKGIKMKRKIN
ncbi:hypothetical protein O181_057593 [Austropuccinia psidii MF-1]|uniref:Uncharacterized protein n=1 Tax=Austropuccinia psidii MF-1 TaxID=1389203 RepID=A0A9Q3EBJ5_9BASI|nr:hypothetical protein [Austropuccinia psidii MF-1]